LEASHYLGFKANGFCACKGLEHQIKHHNNQHK